VKLCLTPDNGGRLILAKKTHLKCSIVFGTGYDHLFASVVLLLEIVLFEPDPVGSAAGLVVFSGVARHFPEISDFLCAWCIANGFLMPSQ